MHGMKNVKCLDKSYFCNIFIWTKAPCVKYCIIPLNHEGKIMPKLTQKRNHFNHHNLPIGINTWCPRAKKNFRHQWHTSVQVTPSQKLYVMTALIWILPAIPYDAIPFSLALVYKHETQAIPLLPSSTSELAGY